MHDIESLFMAHAHALHRYLVRLTGDTDLAADCVQETFVRVIERRGSRDIERAWLFTVATNLAPHRAARDCSMRLASAARSVTRNQLQSSTSRRASVTPRPFARSAHSASRSERPC